MIEFDQIITDLESMKQKPNWFINPVTPEILDYYLSGLKRGVYISQNRIEFHDFVEAYRLAAHTYGLKSASMPSYVQMRDDGVSDDIIVRNMIEIEIKAWKLLQEWVIKHELTPKT